MHPFLPLLISSCGLLVSGHSDPEENMDAFQLIWHNGYKAEEHQVETEDGYLLAVHRIACHRSNLSECLQPRPVVFVQHGLLCSSASWLNNLKNESLAYVLADAGYDVWIGNFRGNSYSKKHKRLSPSSHEFWKFSWDEMAAYDLEAMINKALKVSKQEQLYYIGHSEGTTTAFAKFSTDLEFGNKIKHFYALAPVIEAGHSQGLLKYLAKHTKLLQFILGAVGYNDFLPSTWLQKMLGNIMCGIRFTNPLCTNILFLISGYDSNQMNTTRYPVYFATTPAGTSLQNMAHFGQMVQSGKFQKYDYGSKRKNMEHYNQATAPLYHVENMTVPVTLYWGEKDYLADVIDVAALISRLSSMEAQYYLTDYNHLDFLWGMRAPNDVYHKIADNIKLKEKLDQNVMI